VRVWITAGVVGMMAGVAFAQDLFRVDVDAVDPMVEDLAVGGSSVPDLVEDLLDTQGSFARFEGVDIAASLRYAGVDEAISFTLNADGTRATLQFLGRDAPPLEFEATADRDVEDQIVDFLEKDGSATVADFLKEMNKRSLVAVTDGNPGATTAQMAGYKYRRFGMHQDLTRLERRTMRGEVVGASPGVFAIGSGGIGQEGSQQEGGQQEGARASGGAQGFQAGGADEQDAAGEAAPQGTAQVVWQEPGSDRGLRVRFDVTGGIADADGLESQFVQVASSFEYRLNRVLGVALSLPVSYYNVEEANVFTAGAHLDVPIRLIQQPDGKGFTWQVTPGALLAGSGSFEMVSGGLFWGLGGTTMVSYETGDWLLSASAGYTHFDSISLSIDDFEFDPDFTQDFVRVGGKASYHLGDNAYVFAGLSYSDFLDDAAVDSFVSPTAGVGLRTQNGFNVRLAYEGDFGDGYEAHKAQLGVQLPF